MVEAVADSVANTKDDVTRVEENVSERYAEGAKERQEALCCPVDYQTELLEILPSEIVERDYGCGDPSRYVEEGDSVLDLGSGGGKICYMAAQLVGENGHVHGVDMTDDMLDLARRHQASMAEKIGADRVTFHKGYIQNLALDMDAASAYAAKNPINNEKSLADYEAWRQRQQKEAPMIASGSISLVISNCVLNLVDKKDRLQMLSEIFRVLKPGGRVAISDIISDEHVPVDLQQDKELWSGCISGAFQEQEFLDAFVDAGFVNVGYDKWDVEPWQVVKGIEFRSATLVASKPFSGPVRDGGHALMYRGPFASINDDAGNTFVRGKRMAVSKRTYDFIMSSKVQQNFVGFAPAKEQDFGSFCGLKGTIRSSEITKGGQVAIDEGSQNTGSCC